METMFHNKVSSNSANWSNSGKRPKLPPRIPLPSTIQGLREGGFSLPNGKMHNRLPKDDHKQHQRTSSESFIIEEQPSWLEDLLNEPETPSGRGTHRRSSSDSVAYMDIFGTSSKMQGISQLEFSTNETPSFLPSSVSLPFYMQRDTSRPSSFDISSTSMPSVRGWKSSVNPFSYHNCVASMEDSSLLASFGCSFAQQDMDNNFKTAKQEREKSSEFDDEESADREENMFLKATANVDRCDQKGCFGKDEECSHDKPRATGSDPKRTKQHFAQRSRVRKLQYIAELERTVSILHAEISDVAAELAFLKQRHLILILENKALVQRITTIAHEKKIKDDDPSRTSAQSLLPKTNEMRNFISSKSAHLLLILANFQTSSPQSISMPPTHFSHPSKLPPTDFHQGLRNLSFSSNHGCQTTKLRQGMEHGVYADSG